MHACHFKAAEWAVAVPAYSLRIWASDTGRAVSPGLINLTLTIRDTPTYMMAVRLNYIHIYWIAIGSGSHLRRNKLLGKKCSRELISSGMLFTSGSYGLSIVASVI